MQEGNSTKKEAIFAKIRQSSEFPAISSTITMINKFDPKDDISISEFANLILQDLALTSKILKLVNSVHYMHFGEVTTISRAIILLGFENVKNIAMTLLLFDKLQKHRSNQPLIESLSKSFYSALLSRKITQETAFAEAEESFICSLFHILGKILTSLVSPEGVMAVEEYMKQHNTSESVASLSVFGASYEEIGTTIAKEWNFPSKIIQSMKNMMPSEVVDNPSEVDKLRSISTFTHSIANIISKNESLKDREILTNRLLKTFGSHFSSISHRLSQIIQETSHEFVGFSNIFKLDLINSKFGKNLLGLSDRPSVSQDKVKATTDGLPTSLQSFEQLMEMEDTETPESIFSKGIQDINKSLLSGYSLNDIVKIVLETMYRGLQLSDQSKVLFILKDTTKPVMNVRYGFGADIAGTKQWFEINLDGGNDVFNIAINKQKDFIIKNTSSDDISSMLPNWYKRHINQELFIILLPIVVSNVSIGIYFIEGPREEVGRLTSMHFNNLKILRDQTVMAIKQRRGF